jgi:hypothetical protein
MLNQRSGSSLVEYIVLVVLLLALVGGALLALTNTIWAKLANTNVNLGS